MIQQNRDRAIRSVLRVRSSLSERQQIQLFLQWAAFARQQRAVEHLSETTKEEMQRQEQSFHQSLAELQEKWDASKLEADSQVRTLQSTVAQESRRHAMQEIRQLLETQHASVQQRAFAQWMRRALAVARESETMALKEQVATVRLREVCEVDGDGGGEASRGCKDDGRE